MRTAEHHLSHKDTLESLAAREEERVGGEIVQNFTGVSVPVYTSSSTVS